MTEAVTDRTSLRRRLQLALATGGVVLALLAVVAGIALAAMSARQAAILDVYFTAITEVETGKTALVDAEAAVRGYVRTGDPVSLEPVERLTSDVVRPETEALLREELAPDHPTLQARAEAVEAVRAWLTEFVEPAIAQVGEEGPAAVSEAELVRGRALFAEVAGTVDAYSEALLEDRARAVADLRMWRTALIVTLTVFVAAGVVLGVLLWVFLRRWVTEPLATLAEDARRVTHGDVDHVVTARGPGEVGALALDVERMRARLARLLTEAAQARDALEASHTALEEQAEDLRRSNRDLEQFAYVASHDLQEPLRKVASFTQLLSTRYAGQLDERADQYIAFAVDGAKRMQRLINDLLGFSRVGRIGQEVTDVDLSEALDQALGDLQAVIEETGAEVTAADLPVVRGERPLLVQLFANLVGNAIKFRHPERPPRVRVEVRRVAGFWEFVCRDNGIGIDPQYAERVFVIFQRLHAKDVYEGTGIGLALCKKIVEYHGGDIWIDTDVSEGAAIRWTLPADAEGEAPRVIAHIATDVGAEKESSHG